MTSSTIDKAAAFFCEFFDAECRVQIFLIEQHEVGKRKLFCAYVSAPRKPAVIRVAATRMGGDPDGGPQAVRVRR